ncbi:hypothetical protein AAGS61_17920 [Lysinibacillus sp. KU-BSD001]|uniref:hypothetical protein n=1 Tax=Lysinibacillus sp. KU-BSD001 TaxID=3141328 RepID=UPI0036EE629E
MILYKPVIRIVLWPIIMMSFVSCSSIKISSVEDSNSFIWQKYMNEDEYRQLEPGMSYMEAVEIARGRGKQLDDNTYVWPDELLMTQAYEVYFEEDQLVSKRIIEKRGHSMR